MESYFLCSAKAVELIKPTKISKPFKSGYEEYGVDELYFVAILDFEKVETLYNSLTEEERFDFWCRELVAGTMDVSGLTIAEIKRKGLLVAIKEELGITTEKNIAMTIQNLAEKYNCTPIQFINKIYKK